MKYMFLICFLLAITLPIIFPLFHKGYFPTHDGQWAVVRLTDMFREVKDKQIPPRFSGNLNFGYGYPLFNFAYPFPYYLGLMVHLLKFGFVDSIKMLFGASVLFSGLFMYFAAKTLWKNELAGFISAAFYLYFPYRLVDLYARGSLGESISFALFPAILFFVLKLSQTGKNKYGICLSVLFGTLILTHNVMAVFFSTFLILFILSGLFFIDNKLNIKKIVSFLLLGLGISSFFWLPALVEKKYILLSNFPIADRNLYFVKLSQLLFSKWGYGPPASADGFTYQLGIIHVLVFFSSITIFILKRKAILKPIKSLTFILIGISILFFLLLFKESDFFWHLPIFSEINYPWIILGILGFILSLLSGFLATFPFWKYVVIVGALINILLLIPFAKPQFFIDLGDNYYLTNDATTTSSNELMPLWVKKFPNNRPQNKIDIIKGNGTINVDKISSNQIKFNVNLTTDSVIRVNTIFYPGWNLKEKNKQILYDNPYGVMEFFLPKGIHYINLAFEETKFRLICDWISVFSLIIIVYMIGKQIKNLSWRKINT